MKMLVTKALDERDLVAKRIYSAINSLRPLTVKRDKDKNTEFGISEEEFENEAKATYQSITDLIKRYDTISDAITKSNAKTKIKINDEEMTVAQAIQFRTRLTSNTNNFEDMLFKILAGYKNKNAAIYERLAKEVDRQAELYKSALVGNDSNKKIDNDQIASIENLTKNLEPKYIDPLDIDEKISKLDDYCATIVSEINSAIKISNATTTVDIPD